MALINQPPNSAVDQRDPQGNLVGVVAEWRNFFVAVSNILQAVTMSGTTANRPAAFLWIGRPFFDTTLGIPIWLQSYPPAVWCDATGAPV